MKSKITYIADDGKEFDSEEECLKYEKSLVKTISQSDFIKMSDEDKHNLPIGTLVHLNNDYCDTYEVIHKDKDSIYLMANYQANSMMFDPESYIYGNSRIRKWLNSIYLDNFDKIVTRNMKVMEVASNGEILEDKVKILSCSELGITGTYIRNDEGELYSELNSNPRDYNEDDFIEAWRELGDWGSHYCVWTRSRYTTNSNYVWSVSSSGTCNFNGCTNTYGVLPVICFGAKTSDTPYPYIDEYVDYCDI